MSEPLDVHVVTPDREVWAGDAREIVARGVDGEVGILAGHAPMLLQLAIGPLTVYRDGDEQLTAVVDGGFMHVTSTQGATRVDVMATQAQLRTEIDLDAARARASELEQRLTERRDTEVAEAEVEGLKVELQKQLARIELAG
jgi:F-type H+-transporting ATPase subunit epsilon